MACLHIVGSPVEVMKALTALQRLLPGVSLHCNTAKSCLAYFHDDTAPLPASLLRTLAEQDIAVRHDWMEVFVCDRIVSTESGNRTNASKSAFHE